MKASLYTVEPGLILDARRALWIESARTLAIADLHAGYAWTQRSRGQLLPVDTDDLFPRLESLLKDYAPCQLVLLGDIVHGVAGGEPFARELRQLIEVLKPCSEIVLIAGNHDRNLQSALRGLQCAYRLERSIRVGGHTLLHGDEALPVRGRMIIGHEHPAVTLGDGVTGSRKFPCFLVGRKVIVLPAYSSWAAGSVYGAAPPLSPITKMARFDLAVAIMGNRLLPMPLS